MNPLESQIRCEIAAHGPMSFSRFMDMALYTPGLGYYERRPTVGREGDFYTSVSVGPVFGELLAFQFADWAADSGPVQFVETGAHNGQLALDILRWMRQWRPDLFERLEYILIEPSASRRAWQKETLADFLPKIRWFDSIEQVHNVHGIIFSNELLDAMPAHRLRWDTSSKSWREWRVLCSDTGFTWQTGDVSPGLTPLAISVKLAEVLPDGYTIEFCPAATAWWHEAASTLESGVLMTLDYGWDEEEFWRPERVEGTLAAYSRHRASKDLLANPGEQDLTAHVHFTALREAGERAGLTTEFFASQSRFLTGIFERTLRRPGDFAPWPPQRLRQFKTLMHPDHLGRAFNVLVQKKG